MCRKVSGFVLLALAAVLAAVPSVAQAPDCTGISDVSDFLDLDAADVRDMFKTYRKFHRDKRYAADFGELKTLNLEEAFVLYAVLAARRPTGPLVEIGTQYGRSTRRILDMI